MSFTVSSHATYRTRPFFAPPETGAAEVKPAPETDKSENDKIIFWSFHAYGTRGEEGFVYENEVAGSYSFSKTISGKIGWREAIDLLTRCEEEAGKKLRPALTENTGIAARLRTNDTYDKAEPFQNHFMLQQEQNMAQLQHIAGSMKKLAPRAKTPKAP
ncbi:MAG: hypothetical protein RBS08_01145 [Bdellovibrionales bacterium]|jgi:hypothetical protein|nr:hypothetical protein [Bdellovibrionales bacterium]